MSEKPRVRYIIPSIIPVRTSTYCTVLGKSVFSTSPRSTRNAPRQWTDIPDIPPKLPKNSWNFACRDLTLAMAGARVLAPQPMVIIGPIPSEPGLQSHWVVGSGQGKRITVHNRA